MKVKMLRKLAEALRLISEAAHSEHLTDYARSRIDHARRLLAELLLGLDT